MKHSAIIGLCLVLAGCGAAGPHLVEASATTRPDWIGAPSRPMGGMLYYNGLATGASTLEEARRAARQDALLTMAQEIAVEVGGEIATRQIVVDQQQSVDVRITTSARTERVQVEGIKFVDDYSETWQRTGLVFDAYALVAVPRSAVWRARCDAKGHSLLAFGCEAPVGAVCDAAQGARVRSALSDAGYVLLADVSELGTPTALANAGLERCAAQVVIVEITAQPLGSSGDEHYAEATANLRIIRSGTAEELSAFTVGPVKGGHYSTADALRAALREIQDELASKLKARATQ